MKSLAMSMLQRRGRLLHREPELFERAMKSAGVTFRADDWTRSVCSLFHCLNEAGIVLSTSNSFEIDLTASARLVFRSMKRKKDPAAVTLGRKGGKTIAKRGPEYFRQLQARRIRAGTAQIGGAFQLRYGSLDIGGKQ